MAQNEQEMPWSYQQHLSYNRCWEKQTSHRFLFLCLFNLFTPKYECICDRFYCRQYCDLHAGIFKWNFDQFFVRNCVWNIKESGLMCGSHAWLMCSIQCLFTPWYECVCGKFDCNVVTHLQGFSSEFFLCMCHTSGRYKIKIPTQNAACLPCMGVHPHINSQTLV